MDSSHNGPSNQDTNGYFMSTNTHHSYNYLDDGANDFGVSHGTFNNFPAFSSSAMDSGSLSFPNNATSQPQFQPQISTHQNIEPRFSNPQYIPNGQFGHHVHSPQPITPSNVGQSANQQQQPQQLGQPNPMYHQRMEWTGAGTMNAFDNLNHQSLNLGQQQNNANSEASQTVHRATLVAPTDQIAYQSQGDSAKSSTGVMQNSKPKGRLLKGAHWCLVEDEIPLPAEHASKFKSHSLALL